MTSRKPATDNDTLLSVIVPSHNGQDYLIDALMSLKGAIASSSSSIEIILIDDSSTDDTSAIMHAFAETTEHVRCYSVGFKNIGMVRNFGVRKASGKYITMLDDDDELLPDSLCKICTLLETHRPDILLTKLNEIRGDAPPKTTWEMTSPEKMSQQKLILQYLIHKKIQAHFIGQFIKREILLDNNFPHYTCYEDAFIFPSVIKRCKDILHINKGHYLYFKRDKSLSSSIDSHKVKLLVTTVNEMDIQFGDKYRNLIACHWLGLYLKHKNIIRQEQVFDEVLNKVEAIKLMPFLFDPKIRISFKRKLFQFKIGSKP